MCVYVCNAKEKKETINDKENLLMIVNQQQN